MKKFLLIKEYPGSPKLGIVYDELWFCSKLIPELYPEFWREITEKDYEILFFIPTEQNNTFLGIRSYKEIKKQLETYNQTPENWFEDNHYWDIYSIKRLSDGEIFTVGDKIEGYLNTGIKEIKLHSFGLRIITDANGNGCVTDKLSWKLNECKKNKYDCINIGKNNIIKAIFKGKNSSFGYETNKEYTLSIQHKKGNNILIQNGDKELCEYESMISFLNNWDIIRNV